MKKTFIDKITSKQPPIGPMLSLDSPEIAEAISGCGFDWVFIDTEHGAITLPAAQHMIQAVKSDCSAIIRVPDNSPVWIKGALDLGCDGIVVPLIRSVDDAKRAVEAAKYSPVGSRAVGLARAHEYGRTFEDYLKSANEKVALILQVEHIDAVENLDAILAVKGIDGILIGPYDLSASMGMIGQVTSKPVQAAISKVKSACSKKGMPWGILVVDPAAAKKELEDGASFMLVSLDIAMLVNAAQETARIVQGFRKNKP